MYLTVVVVLLSTVFLLPAAKDVHSCDDECSRSHRISRGLQLGTDFCGTSRLEASRCHRRCAPLSGKKRCPPGETCYKISRCSHSKTYSSGTSNLKETLSKLQRLRCSNTTTKDQYVASNTARLFYCGATLSEAEGCKKECPGGTSLECERGQACFEVDSCNIYSNYCGKTLADAANCLNRPVECPSGSSSQCPHGQSCFGYLDTCPPIPPFEGYFMHDALEETFGTTYSPGPPSWADMSVAWTTQPSTNEMLNSVGTYLYPNMAGDKMMSLGESAYNPRYMFTPEFQTALATNRFSAYDGFTILLDGLYAHDRDELSSIISQIKGKGFIVTVTFGRSAPILQTSSGTFDVSEAQYDLFMREILNSKDIYIIIPWMVDSSLSTQINYEVSFQHDFSWSNYASSVPLVMPMIPSPLDYAEVESFFTARNTQLSGCFKFIPRKNWG